MDVAGIDPQVLVLAIKLKGEVTLAPLAGTATVMADDGMLSPESASAAKRRVFINMPRVMSEHASVMRDCGFPLIAM
jgi:hypothetical protein